MWFSNINGTDATSNHITKTLHNATQVTGGVQLRIYTDNAPEETSWKLYNSEGDVVQTGGPYSQSRHFYTENLQLKQDDCYQLEFLDAGGNGIKGAKGKEAAKATHKRLRQVEFRTQAPDHPILWANSASVPESYYLKFFIFQVVDEK